MKELIIGNIVVEGGGTPENVVTTNTTQTIIGQKTFEGTQNFNRINASEINSVIIRENNQRVYSLAHQPNNLFTNRGLISQGTNFNNLVANGTYTYAQGNWPGNIHANGPSSPAHGYGVLLVSESALFVSQQLFYVNGQIDTRFRNDNGPWTTWQRLQQANASGSGLTNLNANNLASGLVPRERLATGTANNTTFLRGDGVWATPGGLDRQIYNNGIVVHGNSEFNGQVSIGGVSQTNGNLIGLGTMQTRTEIFNALNSYHRLLVTGVGSAWGSALTALLGDPGIGVFATCQARRISFSAENRELRNDRGIIEVIATDPFGNRIRKGWLYNVAGQNCWTGWRDV
ncbi:MAG: pyocin knob domain-containing protein [Erysipelotrichales bacterium]|nr:pyocin knob domain-containing protein [Erysipelotrichales bacterium]